MLDYYFMFQDRKTLSRRNYCLFNVLFQQNCVVFRLSDKKHLRALGSCRFYSKCSSTITLIHAAGSTSSLAKRRDDVCIWKNAIENKHQAKPLSPPFKKLENMVAAQKCQRKPLPWSVALGETLKYGV